MNIHDKLAQRARQHRDKYTGENPQYLEGVEPITRTGETDQGVTVPPFSKGRHLASYLGAYLADRGGGGDYEGRPRCRHGRKMV